MTKKSMLRFSHPNIPILLILRAVRWFLLIMPIVTLFFREHGLSMQQIFIIQSAFSIAVVLFEIPTGYFSDVVGRRKSLILGMFLGVIGLGIYCLANGFWGFMIAELTLGLGSSFISGTDSAMLYDTLLDEGYERENKKMQGYLQTVSSSSEAVASFLGGFLGAISLYLPFYVMFALNLVFLPLAFFLIEPRQHKLKNHDGAWKGILRIVKYSLHDHAEIKWLILFSGAFGASTLVMTWFLQPYFSLVNIPIEYFGVLWSIFNLSLIPFSFFAHRIEQKLGKKTSLISVAFLPIIGFILLATFQAIWALVFVFFFYFARGFGSVVLNDYINTAVSSQIRATVLSVQALMFRLLFSLIGPMLGWVADVYTLPYALFSSAIIFAFFTILSLIFLAKHKSL